MNNQLLANGQVLAIEGYDIETRHAEDYEEHNKIQILQRDMLEMDWMTVFFLSTIALMPSRDESSITVHRSRDCRC